MATATKKKSRKSPAGAVSVTPRPTVDFPNQDETISGPHYAIRVSAPEGINQVEVTIDQGDWQSCRLSSGHWWYDWSGFDDGEHEVTARLVTHEGRSVSSESREFFVRREDRPR